MAREHTAEAKRRVERASYQSPRLEKPTYREEVEDDEPLLLSNGDVVQSIAFPSPSILGRPTHAKHVGLARSSRPAPMERIPGLASPRNALSRVPPAPGYLSRYASYVRLPSSHRRTHAPPFLAGFHRWTINNHRTWGWFSSQTASQALSQVRMHLLPGARFAPDAEIAQNRRKGAEIHAGVDAHSHPVPNTYQIAFITSRMLVVLGRPPGFCGGINGSSTAHSSSLISLG